MIPPAESLLKYGNPILVNKHCGKKSPKVSLSQDSSEGLIFILDKQSVYLFLRDLVNIMYNDLKQWQTRRGNKESFRTTTCNTTIKNNKTKTL